MVVPSIISDIQNLRVSLDYIPDIVRLRLIMLGPKAAQNATPT